MAVGTVHTLYGVNVDIAADLGVSDIFIKGISNQSIDPAIEEMLLASDGMVDSSFVAVGKQEPAITFDTTMIASVLAKIGISGLKIAADIDEPGVEFWFQKVAKGGTREAGSNHLKMTVAEGILVPRQLRATHGGGTPASLSMECKPSWDGTNDPIVIAASQALSGTPGVSEAFTCGPVKINGSAVPGVQDITIDFGITLFVLSSDGQIWPTFIAIQDRKPKITISTLEALVLNTFGLSGAAQAETDSVIYLRKIAQGGTRVANNVAEHISFTVDEGLIKPTAISGAHGQQQTAGIEIIPTYDDANAILAVNTATTIV